MRKNLFLPVSPEEIFISPFYDVQDERNAAMAWMPNSSFMRRGDFMQQKAQKQVKL
jgi:hypothetical protein